MKKVASVSPVPADPEQWSEKSKQSISYYFTREYIDIHYNCWRCKVPCVFTAQDQKYTFEEKKASIDQRRILCGACWAESNGIRAMLDDCVLSWKTSKKVLQHDRAFLTNWMELLVRLEEYVPYKPDTARKNMLKKLLAASNLSSSPTASSGN